MPWKYLKSTEADIAAELLANLQGDGQKGKDDNARLLIMGTETKSGYTMRMTLKHPEAIAGIIIQHALKTGEVAEAVEMCDALSRIAATAMKLIAEGVVKRKAQN